MNPIIETIIAYFAAFGMISLVFHILESWICRHEDYVVLLPVSRDSVRPHVARDFRFPTYGRMGGRVVLVDDVHRPALSAQLENLCRRSGGCTVLRPEELGQLFADENGGPTYG